MTLTIHAEMLQGSDDWFAARRGMVTASTIGQLLTTRHLGAIDYACPACESPANDPCRSKVKKAGEQGAAIKTVHPERTSYALERKDSSPLVIEVADNDTSRGLTALLVAERITGWSDPTYYNADMQRGHDVEPIARDLYAQHMGVEVEQVGFMVEDEWGFPIGFSPDGLVGDEGCIGVKAPRSKTQVLTHLAGEIPASHLPQIQAGLLVSGRDWCDFLSFYGGLPPFIKRVYRDDAWADAIVQAVRKFETTAAEMQATYNANTAGLPMTERLALDMEMSL